MRRLGALREEVRSYVYAIKQQVGRRAWEEIPAKSKTVYVLRSHARYGVDY